MGYTNLGNHLQLVEGVPILKPLAPACCLRNYKFSGDGPRDLQGQAYMRRMNES